MTSPVIFSLTAAQRDYLAALAVQPAAWKTFSKRIRAAAVRSGYTTRETRPALTHAGKAVAGLALVLTKASPIAGSDLPNQLAGVGALR